MAKTMVMADNTKRAMDMEDASRLSLKKDIIFEGINDKYEISIKDYIGAGGESKVYLATRISDKEKVVAKIYDTFTDDPVKKKNRKNVINFLNENNDYKKTHIMPLLDEGMIFMESSDSDDQFQRPLDIIPYCNDGELKQCDYRQLKNKVIPEILIALKTLHGSNLVHRDIKPDNIYIYNDEIVLADFGTTSQILNITDYGKTETKRGTPGYTAPEISDKYFIIESDYYSFGCTIASLYKGEHVYQPFLDKKKYIDINIAMRREGLPLSCPDTEADLQALVNALVMPDSAMRASYDGVALWLNNTTSFVNSWNDKLKQGYEPTTTGFKFKDRICNNKNELTEAMLDDWEYAKQLLYKGGEKNSAIVNYLSKEDQNLSLKAINIIEENRNTVNNQDLGLAMFLHFFNTDNESLCPIYWCGKTYNNLEEISKEIFSNKADENCIIKMLENEFLSWKFANTREKKEDSIIEIKRIEDITAKEKCKQLGYFTFMYRFSSKEEKIETSADNIFWELTNTKEDWHKIAENSIQDDKMLASLINLGWKKNVLAFKEECIGNFNSEKGVSDLLLFYQLFDGLCESKEYIRDHYLQYGPQANIYKKYSNLDYNSFVSNTVKSKIKNLNFNLEMSIMDLFNSFMSFFNYLIEEEEYKEMLRNEQIEEEKLAAQKKIEDERLATQKKIEKAKQRQEKIANSIRQFKKFVHLLLYITPPIVAAILYIISVMYASHGQLGIGIGGIFSFIFLLIPLATLNFANSDSWVKRGISIITLIATVISCMAFSLDSGVISWIAILFIIISSIMAFIKPMKYYF